MKKNLFFAAVLSMGAVAFTACQNEESENLNADAGFSVVASMGIESRTALADDNKTVVWSEGDQIYLFGGTSNATMTLVDGAGDSYATFRGGVNGKISQLTTALYPVPTVNGDTYTYELPAQRTYSENSAAPMVGNLTDGSVTFTNLTPLVRVPLTNLDDSKEHTVTLTMSDVIAGKATVTVGENPALAMDENGSKTVTVTIPAGITECNVDFPIPADTYTSYTLKVNDAVWASADGISEELEKDDVLILGIKAATEVTPDADNVYSIKTATELLWVAEQVNGGTTFKEKTIKLEEDIDLSGINWTPIGDCNSGKYFQGVFDGDNHTISNLYVDKSSDTDEHSTAGLFGWVDAAMATIKNVKVDNATVKGSHWTGVIAGYFTGTIEGCSVTNSNVEGFNQNDEANGDKIGGIVGYLNEHSYLNDNSVKNCTIKGNRDIGGIAGGVAASTYEMKNNTVADVTITYRTIKDYASAGQFVSGRTNYTPDDTNVATNVTIKYDGTIADSNDLTNIIASGTNYVTLADGEYDLKNLKNKAFTINGTKETVIKVVGAGQGEANGQLDYDLDGSTVIFNGVTIQTNNQTYAGYTRLTATYNNCIINGHYSLQRNSIFNDCVLNVSGDQYNIWTWGAPEATFTNCTFNSDGKAMLLYGTANTKLTINNCVFNDNGGLTDKKAAIEIGDDYGKSYELIVNNTTVNGYEINDKGIITGTTLWGNKNSMGKDKLNVVVDGVDVY